ncbi:hypothetical protein J2Z60_001573 [Lactobacillus colini]|uniref:Uncharacterized protein n=1 Tax=Lactobacillus colini TaxID=1819254 RepID=A0ABS4MFF1_9LACO|nr:hypothetical protein [Lactobacillus colini]
MEDNVEMLVMNMNSTFQQAYFKNFNPKDQNTKVLKSAQVIILANRLKGMH